MGDNLRLKQQGYIFIAIAIVCWGLSSTFVELGLSSIPSIPFLFYRFAISLIILTPLVLVKKRSIITILFKNSRKSINSLKIAENPFF